MSHPTQIGSMKAFTCIDSDSNEDALTGRHIDGQDKADEQERGDALEAGAAMLVHVCDQGPSLDLPRAPKVPLAPQKKASDKAARRDDFVASRQSRAKASASLPNGPVNFDESNNNCVAYCNRHADAFRRGRRWRLDLVTVLLLPCNIALQV